MSEEVKECMREKVGGEVSGADCDPGKEHGAGH
jgi:hypothetical protein